MYTVLFQKKKRGKTLSVRLLSDDSFVVSVPPSIPLFLARTLMKTKTDLYERLLVKKLRQREALRTVHGVDDSFFKKYDSDECFAEKEKLIAVARARALVFLDDVASYYDAEYQKVRIMSARTKWGSCSSQKVLSFHYKMALLPDDLAHYLVVHEVCHLKQMNHSKDFWALVEELCPDYKEKRKILRSIPCA